jgi:DNA polymerase-3 subunit gamma/tau
MSYKVLSLKLRPNQFNQIVGQQHVTKTLQNAINLNRVAHGYIFSGPRGVGKTTTARILAKVLNCSTTNNNNSCEKCHNCSEIKQGKSLDVQELDAASNRGIDEIRDLREAVKYPPNNSKYRIYIIDEVHMLTREAFNALLKTLEEPPPHVIFIMATTDAHKIPPTILSRTQKFDFKHISINDISNYLSKVLEMENIEYDSQGIYLIAQKAEGSLRDALSLLDQVIAYAEKKIDTETIRNVLGIIKENIFLELIQTLNKKDDQLLIQQLINLINNGYSISNFINGFNIFLRNCMIHNTNFSGKLNLSIESTNWLKSSCQFSTNNFLEMLEVTLQFESKLRFLQHPQISLETLFLRLSLIGSNDIKQNNITILKAPQKKNNQEPLYEKEAINIKEDNTEKKNESNTINIDDQNLSIIYFKNNWVNIIDELEIKNSKVANFLENIELKEFTENQLFIELLDGHKFQLNALERDVEQIEQIINKQLNKKIKILFSIKNMDENKNDNEDAQNLEHPLFTKALEKFEGEIIR